MGGSQPILTPSRRLRAGRRAGSPTASRAAKVVRRVAAKAVAGRAVSSTASRAAKVVRSVAAKVVAGRVVSSTASRAVKVVRNVAAKAAAGRVGSLTASRAAKAVRSVPVKVAAGRAGNSTASRVVKVVQNVAARVAAVRAGSSTASRAAKAVRNVPARVAAVRAVSSTASHVAKAVRNVPAKVVAVRAVSRGRAGGRRIAVGRTVVAGRKRTSAVLTARNGVPRSMTQMELARQGKVTDAMAAVAAAEGVPVEAVRRDVAAGLVAIPVNKNRRSRRIMGVGRGLRVKVNANLGTSTDYCDVAVELEKLRAAQESGADAIMDLSTGGDIPAIRRQIMDACDIAVGTVPVYEAAAKAVQAGRNIATMTAADMLDSVRNHARDGVDFVTVHCGVTRRIAESAAVQRRVCGIVSRGGTFLAHWMLRQKQENPFFERFDEVLDIAREFDVTLSLGDGLRPGAIADAMDTAQVEELQTLAELARRAVAAGVQVMLEGPGHVPLDQVEAQIKMQKAMTGGLPFYVLGPIVTDVAPGYDHITSAIGGAVAGMAGADFLCYVTPTEHLGLPRPEDVREGVIAARIAAHAADVARGRPDALAWDRRFSAARAKRDWDVQLSDCIDPIRARRLREERRSADGEVCSMCGEFCAFKVRNGDSEAKGHA